MSSTGGGQARPSFVPLPRSPSARARHTMAPAALQGRRSEGAIPGLSNDYQCTKCAITYAVPKGDKANCPLCKAEKDMAHMRIALQESLAKVENLEARLQVMASQIDHVVAMREALDIIGTDDLAWLKSVLYRYRSDTTLSLMVMSPPLTPGQRRRKLPDRFVLASNGRDNEEHRPQSPGGVAILGYFDEVTNELGSKKAMSYLLRALGQTLTGGTR